MNLSDLKDADVKSARLTLKLRAKSGFSCEYRYSISPNQWAAILRICEEPTAHPATQESER